MRVVALRKFKDLEAGVVRQEGAVFEVTGDRYTEINSTMHGALVEPIEEPEPEEEREAWPDGQDD